MISKGGAGKGYTATSRWYCWHTAFLLDSASPRTSALTGVFPAQAIVKRVSLRAVHRTVLLQLLHNLMQ